MTGQKRINLAELRGLAEGNGEWDDGVNLVYAIGGPSWETVLALIDAVEAAYICTTGDFQDDAQFDRFVLALARFDFGESA